MDETTMKDCDSLPELIDYDSHKTREGWDWMLDEIGHVWFAVGGRYYAISPDGNGKFGLCYGVDERTGNFPRWTFYTKEELLNAKVLDGKCILDWLPDIKGWEPPFYREA